MTLKLRILKSLTRLFMILVSLARSLFSEKMLISNRCISGLMSNLIEKSWTDSSQKLRKKQRSICLKSVDIYEGGVQISRKIDNVIYGWPLSTFILSWHIDFRRSTFFNKETGKSVAMRKRHTIDCNNF